MARRKSVDVSVARSAPKRAKVESRRARPVSVWTIANRSPMPTTPAAITVTRAGQGDPRHLGGVDPSGQGPGQPGMTLHLMLDSGGTHDRGLDALGPPPGREVGRRTDDHAAAQDEGLDDHADCLPRDGPDHSPHRRVMGSALDGVGGRSKNGTASGSIR